MLSTTNNDSLEAAFTGNSILIEAPGYFEHLSKLDAPLLSANGLPILVWELVVPSDVHILVNGQERSVSNTA